jgi:D-inositol-3-phosphate glycosyltransferase
VGQSVDALLNVFARPLPIPPAAIVRQLEELIATPSSGDRALPDRAAR